MLYVYLAMTGGEVIIPDGAGIIDVEGEEMISIVDAEQRVLAIFRREDISLRSDRPLPRVCPD